MNKIKKFFPVSMVLIGLIAVALISTLIPSLTDAIDQVRVSIANRLQHGSAYIKYNGSSWVASPGMTTGTMVGTNGMYLDFSTSGVVKVLNANASDGVLSCVTPQGDASFITSITDGTATFYNHSLHFSGVYYPVKIFNFEQITGTNCLTFYDNDSDNEGSKFIVGSIGAGVYKIEAEFHSTNATASATLYGAIFKNNTLVSKSTSIINVTTTGSNNLSIECQIPLVANDRVAVKIAKRGTDGTFFYTCREAKFRVSMVSR